MYIRPYLAGIVVLLATFVRAGDYPTPTQFIKGTEDPYPPGELVRLWVPPLLDKPKDLISVAYAWKVFDGGKEKTNVEDLGNRIIFGTGLTAKHMTAIVAVTYLFQGADNKPCVKVSLLTADVVVGAPPGPAPNPQPTPPTPTPDPNLSPLAKFVVDNSSKVTKPDSRVKGSRALAASLRGVSSAIAAGTLKAPKDILEQVANGNNAGLTAAGVPIDDWDAFGQTLQDKLNSMYSQGLLKTPADYAQAFRDLSDGFDKVVN